MRFVVFSSMLSALLKADGGLFGSMAPHTGPRHPPLTTRVAKDGTQMVLLRSRENPTQMRWQRADHGVDGGAPPEAARQVLREANRPGGLALTRARLENPDVHALVARGYMTVKPAPLHYLAEFQAEITRSGREWIEHFDQLARTRAAGEQQSLFKARLGLRLAALVALIKAQQLRLFGPDTPVHVAPHVAHNPGGHGTHLVVAHQRHIDAHPNLPPATPTPTTRSSTPAEHAAGVSFSAEHTAPVSVETIEPGAVLVAPAVEVNLPEHVEDSRAPVAARRGKTYHELSTSPHEWRPAEISGFAEATNPKGEIVGMPVFDVPKGYQPVKTRFSGGGLDDGACELCGAKIKNVSYIVNDKQKLSMIVGSKCVESHADALMPGTVKTALKTFSTRLKAEEIAPTNELVQAGVPASIAAARVRARLSAADRVDKAMPPPTEAQHTYWEQTRARVAAITRRRARGEYLPRGDYDFAYGSGHDRHFRSVMEPKSPQMLADEIRERAGIQPAGLRRAEARAGRSAWPDGWDEEARARLEQLETMREWPAPGEGTLDLYAVRDAFFPHLGLPDLHHAVSRRMVPDWAEIGRSLDETRAVKRQEAADKAERKVVLETHPTMARVAALRDKSATGEPWTDEEQAWVSTEVAAVPAHLRPKGTSTNNLRRLEAITARVDEAVRMEPLRKARFTVGQLHAVAQARHPELKAVPPAKHVRYHHPDTGEERTGQVISGGHQGITVADHETGQTAKVHHGHYVVADAPPKPDQDAAKGKAHGKPGDEAEPRKLRADTRDASGRSLHDRLEEVGRRLPDYRAAVAVHRRVKGSAAAGRAEEADAAEKGLGKVSPEAEEYIGRHLGGDVGVDDLRAYRASRLFAEHAAEHGDERAAAEHVSKELGAGRRARRAHYAVHGDPHQLDGELAAKHGGKVTMHGPGRAVGFHREADRDAYLKAATGAKKLPAGHHPQADAEDVHDAEPMLDQHVAPSVVAAHRAGKRMGKAQPDDTEAIRERRFAEHLGKIGGAPQGQAEPAMRKGARFVVSLAALRKAAQLGLFGGETPVEARPRRGGRPAPDPRQGSLFGTPSEGLAKPEVTGYATAHPPEPGVTMSQPPAPEASPLPVPPAQPPSGFVPIPGTKHGGWRQPQAGGGYRYWYPDSPGVGHVSPKPEDRDAVAALDAPVAPTPATAPPVAPMPATAPPEVSAPTPVHLSIPFRVWGNSDVKEFNQNWDRPIKWIQKDQFVVKNMDDAKGMLQAIAEWMPAQQRQIGKHAAQARMLESLSIVKEFHAIVEAALAGGVAAPPAAPPQAPTSNPVQERRLDEALRHVPKEPPEPRVHKIGVGSERKENLPKPGHIMRRGDQYYVITSVDKPSYTDDGRSFSYNFDEGWMAQAEARLATPDEAAKVKDDREERRIEASRKAAEARQAVSDALAPAADWVNVADQHSRLDPGSERLVASSRQPPHQWGNDVYEGTLQEHRAIAMRSYQMDFEGHKLFVPRDHPALGGVEGKRRAEAMQSAERWGYSPGEPGNEAIEAIYEAPGLPSDVAASRHRALGVARDRQELRDITDEIHTTGRMTVEQGNRLRAIMASYPHLDPGRYTGPVPPPDFSHQRRHVAYVAEAARRAVGVSGHRWPADHSGVQKDTFDIDVHRALDMHELSPAAQGYNALRLAHAGRISEVGSIPGKESYPHTASAQAAFLDRMEAITQTRGGDAAASARIRQLKADAVERIAQQRVRDSREIQSLRVEMERPEEDKRASWLDRAVLHRVTSLPEFTKLPKKVQAIVRERAKPFGGV